MAKKKKFEETEETNDTAKKVSKSFSMLEEMGIEVLSPNTPDEFPYMIPFSHLGLQKRTGGGICGGTLCEISGPSKSGKSYLAYDLMASTIKMGGKVLLDDGENAFKKSYGERVGLIADGQSFFLKKGGFPTIPQSVIAYRKFIKYVRNELGDTTCPILIVRDSFAMWAPESDIEKIEDAKEASGYSAMRVNAEFGAEFKTFVPTLEKTATTMVLINQLTTKYEDRMGQKVAYSQSLCEDKIMYFCTQRLRGARGRVDGSSKEIKQKVPSLSKFKDEIKRIIGMWTTWEVLKSRNTEAHSLIECRVMFRTGLAKLSGLSEILTNDKIIEKCGMKVLDKKKNEIKAWAFRVLSTGERFPYSKQVENVPSLDVEKAIAKIIEKHPEFVEPDKEYYGKDIYGEDERHDFEEGDEQ